MDSKRQNAHFNKLIRKSLTAELMPASGEGRVLRAVEAASAEGIQGQSSERQGGMAAEGREAGQIVWGLVEHW